MPTTDERREVAARLREVWASGCTFVSFFEFDCDDFETCQECSKCCGNRLADLIEPESERTVNLAEAVEAICGEMCGDGWDWHNRAEAVVKTVAEMCGAKVVRE